MQAIKTLKGVKAWPKSERPREKLMEQGAQGLSDAELLAVLLGSGPVGKDVVQFSRELLAHFGGLRQVLHASGEALAKVKGLGPAKIAALSATFELGRRQFKERISRQNVIRDPQSVVDYLCYALRDHKKEIFKVLYLDKANRLIAEKDLFHGTVDETAVHPREVIQTALEQHATALILVHNHPSGRLQPSREDVEMTRKLKTVCEAVSIKILDHLIIGDSGYFSFTENQLVF